MEWWMKSKEERREEYKRMNQEIRIMDLAAEYGMELKKVGHYYTWTEHTSIRIHPGKNCFIRNSVPDKAGGPIDFALAFTNKSKAEILKDFSERLGLSDLESKSTGEVPKKVIFNQAPLSQPVELEPPVEFELPEADSNMRNVFAYLTKTRKLDINIIQKLVNEKRLYQDKKRNCVFVSYDDAGKPIFATLRGTNTNIAFKGDVSGSNYDHCFYIDNGALETIVTESVIDGLSIMTLRKDRGLKEESANYLCLASATKYEAIFKNIQEHPEVECFTLGLDADKAGFAYTDKIIEVSKTLQHKPVFIRYQPTISEDWNKELVYLRENPQPYFLPTYEENILMSQYYLARKKSRMLYGEKRKEAIKAMQLYMKGMERMDIPEKLIEEMNTDIEENIAQGRFIREKVISSDQVQMVIAKFNQKNGDKKVTERKSFRIQELHLPKPDRGVEEICKYLIKTRQLDKEIIDKLIESNLLYQDINKNCIFIKQDGEGVPEFLSVCKTSIDSKEDIKVGGDDTCLYIDNGALETIVTNGVIDSLSIMTLRKFYELDVDSVNYLCLSGLDNYKAIFKNIREHPEVQCFTLGLEANKMGFSSADKIIEEGNTIKPKPVFLRFHPSLKENWNKELGYLKENEQKKYFLPFFEENLIMSQYYLAKKNSLLLSGDKREAAILIMQQYEKGMERMEIPNGVKEFLDIDIKHNIQNGKFFDKKIVSSDLVQNAVAQYNRNNGISPVKLRQQSIVHREGIEL